MRFLTQLGFASFILFIFSGLSFGQTFSETWNSTTGNIPDSGPQTCFDVTVSGIGNLDGTTIGITEICLDITHTWTGDLDIFLVSPSGTTVELTTDNGGSGDDLTSTCFDMSAGTAITAGTAPFTGSFVPEGNLYDFNNNQNANGIWQICITDDAGGDTGEINSASITFGVPPAGPTPPPNDDPCSATTLPVGAGTCTFVTYTNENATASAGVPEPGCAFYSGGDVWFTITVPASGSVDIDMNTGVITDAGMAIYSGTCGSLTRIECDDDDSPNGAMSFISLTGQTPGAALWIRVWEYGNNNNGTFDICASEPAPPGPCTGDMAINSTLFSGSGYTTCGFGDDYSSIDACGSSYMNGDDIVIEYTPTNTQCVQIALSNTDTWVGLFVTDGCPDDPGTTCIAQATNSSGNPILNGLNVVAGTTYFITISTFPSPQCTPFDIDITACPPPPANDECSNAQSVPVTPQGGTCTSTSGTIQNATTSSQTNDCFGTADDDVWYSFVATTTDVQIDLSNITGSTTDMYFSVYGGSCGTPGAALLCSDPNSGQVSGLTIGNTYFIRVYSYTSTGGQSTSFDICVGELGPCGISSASEDYCPYPATLMQGPGSWTSTTYDYYTADTPANSGTLFCGSVENNSWYEFTALSTTETFNFTSVTSCTWGDGVQAEVYEVTYDASGCCSAFTSMSNCMNPGIAQPGTVTANGLTIGNQYILMVDGWGGDNCAFTVSGWTAQGIVLSVELVDLGAIQRETENVIYWKTSSEKDNDYFEVQRSFDGIVYSTIGIIEGQGTTQDEMDYWFPDTDVRNGKVYYRLVQNDFDGMKQTSQVITLNRNMTTVGMQSIYPNPAGDAAFVEVNLKTLVGNATITVKSTEGKIVYSSVLKSETTDLIHTLDLKNYSQGVYLITLTDDEGFVQTQKLIKQ